MTSAPLSRSACDRSSSLCTIARTALPSFNSNSVTVRPTPPRALRFWSPVQPAALNYFVASDPENRGAQNLFCICIND